MPYLGQSAGTEGIVVQIVERIGISPSWSIRRSGLGEDITKAHYGYHFPLHCGSKGQVLLASEEPEFVDSVSPPRSRADDGRDDHRSGGAPGELAEIRERGFALTVGDVQPFTGSLAAPIRDASGRVVGALCFVFRKGLRGTRSAASNCSTS